MPPQATSTTTDFPPIQLHVSNAVTDSFTPEAESERAKVVMQSQPRMPAVGFYGGRYGDKWNVDMVALSHNAIRRQLYDAFTIANALGKLSLDIVEADLARVYAWLGTLNSFVTAVFDAEDRFLYPIIESNIKKARTSDGQPVTLPELLSVRGRHHAKTHILELLSTARKTRNVATGEITAKINALRYALDQFGANMLDYFAAMERFVPKLLKKAIRNGTKEKEKMEKKVFEYMSQQPHGAMLAALLMQCIESRSKRHDFLTRNIKKEKDRISFKEHVKKVEATHMTLAPAFDTVATKYERRFNVSTFLQHYASNADAKQTLEMFGDMDINEEGMGTDTEIPSNEDVIATQSTQLGSTNGNDDEEEDGVGMDDDVIEITYTEIPGQ